MGAAAALALLLTLPAAPARAECGTTVERGTYEPDTDTFTPGTAATDTDIRFECTESDTDDNSYISFESLPDDAIPDDIGPGSYVVVDLNGTNNFLPSTAIDPYWIIRFSGIETTDPIWQGDGIAFYNLAGNSLRVEFRGPITTRGDGARGVFVWAAVGGSATAINRGTINTHGGVDTSSFFDQAAHGIYPLSDTGDAVGTNYGHIETRGNAAQGISASASGDGTATATNYGTAIARGGMHLLVIPAGGDPSTVGQPVPPAAVNAYSGGGDAHAANMAGATAEAHGQGGSGVSANARGAGHATAENSGTVVTSGDHYEVTDPESNFHGSERYPSGVSAFAGGAGEARAVNHAGGMIETRGTGGLGLVAWGLGTGDATATNRGTIVTRGDAVVTEVRGLLVAAIGVEVQSQQGDATILNTGDVTVTGAGAIALRALSPGSGTATVNMTDGSVTASAVDDASTADIDEGGIGIVATTGDTGTASVTVSGNATVTAPTAARLIGGTTSLLVNNGQLTGNVVFGDGTSTLETRGFGLIDGDVTFGAGGDDTLIINALADLGLSGVTGDVTGVEDMIKRGSGTARVNNVTFTGSSLTIEEGSLNVRGHVDLGTDGTVTVEDAGRLTMEIGDVGNDADDHGQVTAGGGVTLEGDEPAVFAAYDPGLSDAQREAAQTHLQSAGFTPFSEGTGVTASSGADVTLRTENESGEETVVGSVSGGTAMLAEGSNLGSAVETGPAPAAPEEPEEPTEPADEEPAAAAGGGGSDGAPSCSAARSA